ncbi:cytochrome P450 [Xylariaceae sp. AK1471]|nr:cytochrome P450 [Xylariaceae sp. AK1471]
MQSLYPLAFASGVLSHVAYFRVGEHHLYGIRYAFAIIALFVSLVAIQTYLRQTPLSESIAISSSVVSLYLGGLYTSLALYRTLFHSLRRFPGPFGCKLSGLWFVTYLSKHDAFRQLEALHKEHGLFVRVGSNDLSVAHPKAVQAIYGLGSRCRKADWYDLTYPMISLQSTRDGSIHAQRRRIWSAAFGDKHLSGYEKRMAPYRALLVKAIEQSGGREMDVAKWFNLYTFDVMGDLAFGSSFGMLETSKEHKAIRLLISGLWGLGFKLPMWCFKVMTGIPGMAREWWGFIQQSKPDIPDIMSVLLSASKDRTPTKLERTLLEGDSQLIVVAGSDTTSTTLSTVFRFLAQFPHHVDLLRAELAAFPRNELGDYAHTDLAKLEHLNGVINESLRLFPPVPTILPRLTPPDGLDIEGTFIPGNTTVFCPQYVLGRSEQCYVEPNSFIPERWYSRPDLVRDASGFAPFSAGHYGCIGRPLGLLNVRTTLCRIIADYDVHATSQGIFADYDNLMTEHFTLSPSSLKLSFTKRGGSK